MANLYTDIVGMGLALSPLDIINTAVTASANWTVRRTVQDPTDNYLSELWVDATNTSNSETMGFIAKFTRGVGMTVSVCKSIDVGQTEENQALLAPTKFSTSVFSKHATLTAPDVLQVVIDRDFIVFQGTMAYAKDGNPYPHTNGFFLSTIEKTSTYSGAIVFFMSDYVGEGSRSVFYEDIWYGVSATAASNDLMARINAIYTENMFTPPLASAKYFYSKISVHVNTLPLGESNNLILLGYLPGGLFGTKVYYQNKSNFKITLDEQDYVGLEDFGCEAIDTILYPI